MVNPLIVIGLVVCVGSSVAIGLYTARWVNNSLNFIVAGRRLTLPLAAAALMAQAVDGNATLGNTDSASQLGFWAGASLPLGLAISLVLTGLFVAEPLHKMKLLTLPDFYFKRYGPLTEKLASSIMVASFAILLAGNLAACGFVAESFLGINYSAGVILFALFIFLYTLAGGLVSCTFTDIFQIFLAIIGALAGLFFMVQQFGMQLPQGLGPFDMEQLTQLSAGAGINWATLLALGLGDIVAIDFIERVLSADSPKTAKRACFIGALGTVIVGVSFTLIAQIAVTAINIPASDTPLLFTLINQHFPILIGVLILSAVVGASMSTIDGAILGTSTVAANNIWGIGRQIKNPETDRKLLRATRIAAIPITLFGVLFAIYARAPGILLVLAFDLAFAGALIPLILGLYWKKANAAAALTSLIVGTLIRLVMFALTPTCYGFPNEILYIPNNTPLAAIDPATGVAIWDGIPTIIAPVVSLILFIVVAFVTSREN